MATSCATDVLVIGAGQAALALTWHLRGLPFRVHLVDRVARVGDSWRARYDSLTLFSPRALSALPGMRMPGDPDGYPTKDEVADYLEAYARWLGVAITLGADVRRLSRTDGLFRAATQTGDVFVAPVVVVAAGAFQDPLVPPFASGFSPEVVQLTAATYRAPRQLSACARIMVAGDGATGRQIALELTPDHDVSLATGRTRVVTAQRILGRDQLWWSDRLGLLRASRETLAGRLIRRLDTFPGPHLRLRQLRRRGVRVRGRIRGARGREALFDDDAALEVDAVVWAIGYRERTEWLDIADAKDASGGIVERRGAARVPGLYFVGREWQWTRGSALLAGVERDAAYVVGLLAAATGAVRTAGP